MGRRHTRGYSLTEEELCSYRAAGFLVRESVFDDGELVLLREAVERAVTRAVALTENGNTYFLDGKRFVDVGTTTVQFEHCEGSGTTRVIEPAQGLDDAIDDLIRDSRIVEAVASIVGGEVSIWTNKLNLKRAGEGSGFGWHQDSPYWIHDCDHVDLLPNVYLAFDDATIDNGCLRVIRGSHLRGCLPGTDDGTQLGGFFTSPDCVDGEAEVALEVAAGSLVFFDPHIIHGSRPNHSDSPRRAIVMTYQPAGYPMLKTREVHNVA